MAASNGSDSQRDPTGRLTECFGVGVLPGCFALWSCDSATVTLTLDLRSGAATDVPWGRGNERFPDMERLAAEMVEQGVRPGIWVRYLINGQNGTRIIQDFPEECYTERRPTVLDPSHPLVLDYVRETTGRLVRWGYTLIKHDYSTFDLFGKWGMQIKRFPAEDGDGWGFYDRTKTTAEIIMGFHKAIREASGDAVIIGCNVMGHLCAGLHHCNRTGDDTRETLI